MMRIALIPETPVPKDLKIPERTVSSESSRMTPASINQLSSTSSLPPLLHVKDVPSAITASSSANWNTNPDQTVQRSSRLDSPEFISNHQPPPESSSSSSPLSFNKSLVSLMHSLDASCSEFPTSSTTSLRPHEPPSNFSSPQEEQIIECQLQKQSSRQSPKIKGQLKNPISSSTEPSTDHHITTPPATLAGTQSSLPSSLLSSSNIGSQTEANIPSDRHCQQLFIAAKDSCIRKVRRLAELFPLWAQQNQSLSWHTNAILRCDGWPDLLRYVDILQQLAGLNSNNSSLLDGSNLPAVTILKRLQSIRDDVESGRQKLTPPVIVKSERPSGNLPTSHMSKSFVILSPTLSPGSSQFDQSKSSESNGQSVAQSKSNWQRSSRPNHSVVLGQHPAHPVQAISSSSSVRLDKAGTTCFEPLPVPGPRNSVSGTPESDGGESPHLVPSRRHLDNTINHNTSLNVPELVQSGLTTQMAAAIILLSRTINLPVLEVRSILGASCTANEGVSEDVQNWDGRNSESQNRTEQMVVSPNSSPSSRRSSLSSQDNNPPSSSIGTSFRSMKGVSFDRSKRNWEASWLDARTGRRIKKCFSEGRWGSSARDMAILARREAEDSGVISTRQQHNPTNSIHSSYELLMSPKNNSPNSSISSNITTSTSITTGSPIANDQSTHLSQTSEDDQLASFSETRSHIPSDSAITSSCPASDILINNSSILCSARKLAISTSELSQTPISSSSIIPSTIATTSSVQSDQSGPISSSNDLIAEKAENTRLLIDTSALSDDMNESPDKSRLMALLLSDEKTHTTTLAHQNQSTAVNRLLGLLEDDDDMTMRSKRRSEVNDSLDDHKRIRIDRLNSTSSSSNNIKNEKWRNDWRRGSTLLDDLSAEGTTE